jgi:AAA15 family ATPase/GTPase
MLLEIKVKNFRSIKDEVVFSMVAESYKSKDINVFTQPVANDEPVRLLKVAAIWGPNASGKSNLLKAVDCLAMLLQNPPEVGKPIPQYDPFIFTNDSENAPTYISVAFIGPNQVRFEYKIAFNRTSIVEEQLTHFPKGKAVKYLYRINGKSERIDEGVWKKKKYDIYNNQLFLTQFRKNIADEALGEIYIRLGSFIMVNATHNESLQAINHIFTDDLVRNAKTLERLNQLISKVDTRLERLEFKLRYEGDTEKPIYEVLGSHKFYENSSFSRLKSLPIEQESQGIQNLFALGNLIFNMLNISSPIFIDELDTSLHPFVAKLIIELFQNEETNPKNAQLIFTTHDTSLLDETNLRRDQIWFTEKDEFGVTDLYALQDIEGVREDASFEKGYRAGKYRAIPKIPSVATIFAK